MEVQCAIATYLEYLDFKEMLPELSKEDEWREAVELFSPRLSELLMTFGNPEKLPGRLEAIGLMRRDVDNREYRIFSPLLERWLRRKRDMQFPLYEGGMAAPWRLTVDENVASMTKDLWLQLDGDLAEACDRAKVDAPLMLKKYTGSWDILVAEVRSREAFRSFVQAACDCFVERGNGPAMIRYLWLFLAYHRTRLVRIFFTIPPPTGAAEQAWTQGCKRALGGMGEEPRRPDEWRTAQLALLRG